MVRASVIVKLGIFIATVIAAVIALRSVNDACQARDETSAHEHTALNDAVDQHSPQSRTVRVLETPADGSAQQKFVTTGS
jgi:hypothetical protein